MFTVLIVFHVLLAAALIAMVLLQRGPGATMGAAFGAGASGTVFGSRGASSFLTRTTAGLALGFFLISLTMAVLAARSAGVGQEQELGVVGAERAAGPAAEAVIGEDEEFLLAPEVEDEAEAAPEPPAELEPPVD